MYQITVGHYFAFNKIWINVIEMLWNIKNLEIIKNAYLHIHYSGIHNKSLLQNKTGRIMKWICRLTMTGIHWNLSKTIVEVPTFLPQSFLPNQYFVWTQACNDCTTFHLVDYKSSRNPTLWQMELPLPFSKTPLATCNKRKLNPEKKTSQNLLVCICQNTS